MKQHEEEVEVTIRVGADVAQHLTWLGDDAINVRLLARILRTKAEQLAGCDDDKCMQQLINAQALDDAVEQYVDRKLWLGYLRNHMDDFK